MLNFTIDETVKLLKYFLCIMPKITTLCQISNSKKFFRIYRRKKTGKLLHLGLIIYKKFTNEAHLKLFLSTKAPFGGIMAFGKIRLFGGAFL